MTTSLDRLYDLSAPAQVAADLEEIPAPNIGKGDWQKLNRLFGHALVYETVCQRLVEERDSALLAEFGLSPLVQKWLKTVPATSLTELAEIVLNQT